MKGLKKYSSSLTLIGIFLLPAVLNIFHFVWIDHHKDSHQIHHSNDLILHSQNPKDHNCEQFFFKVPASESLDLSYEFIQKLPKFIYKKSIEINSINHKNDKGNSRLLRGPPFQV